MAVFFGFRIIFFLEHRFKFCPIHLEIKILYYENFVQSVCTVHVANLKLSF